MYAMRLVRCAALDMCTAILRELRIIAIIPKAVPVVTVARTTIIAAWGIYLSIAMVMAVATPMSISIMNMRIVAAVMSISIMSMRIVAAVMSIITSTHIMCRGIPMTAYASFAILTRSTAMFVAKA